MATPSLTEKISEAEEEFFISLNKEGARVYTAYARSAEFGWTAAIGAPEDVIEAPIERTVVAALLRGSGAAGLTLALVIALGRMSARRQAVEDELATERRLSQQKHGSSSYRSPSPAHVPS